MDGVLALLDEYVFDDIYAKLIPAGLFADPPIPASSPLANLHSSASAWTSFVKSLPHPPISSVASSASLSSPSAIATLSAWPREYVPRQVLSLSVVTLIGIHLLYFIFATASYYLIFKHDMMRHPKFLKNQVRLEIASSLRAFPVITLLTLPIFLGEVRGYSFLYGDVSEYGWFWFFASIPMYLVFTDYLIYWIHRLLHHPVLYKRLHKPHHKWLIPTPFASHAFHPVDGWLQSVPYHLYIFIFPIHRWLYMGLFVAVNFWSIFIHDSDMVTGHALETVINGPAHHTLHHLYFTCNYGQYFTWADKKHDSYRQPEAELDPMLDIQAMDAQSKKEQ